MAAGIDAIECAKVIGNQVISVFSSILSIATFGAAGAVTKGAKAVKAAVKVGKVVATAAKAGLDCGLSIAKAVEDQDIIGGTVSSAVSCIGGAVAVGKGVKGLKAGAEAATKAATEGAKVATKVAKEAVKEGAEAAGKTAKSNWKSYQRSLEIFSRKQVLKPPNSSIMKIQT